MNWLRLLVLTFLAYLHSLKNLLVKFCSVWTSPQTSLVGKLHTLGWKSLFYPTPSFCSLGFWSTTILKKDHPIWDGYWGLEHKINCDIITDMPKLAYKREFHPQGSYKVLKHEFGQTNKINWLKISFKVTKLEIGQTTRPIFWSVGVDLIVHVKFHWNQSEVAEELINKLLHKISRWSLWVSLLS